MTPKHRLCSHATAVFAALMLFVPARANVIVSQLHTSGSAQIQGNEPLGEAFTAVSDELLGFEFYFLTYNPGTPNYSITLDIRQGAGTSGTVLASSTLSLASGYNGWAGLSFSLGVTDGQQYTATLETGSPYWGVETYGKFWGDSYAAGQGYENGFAEPMDYTFQATFADPTIPGVPDAASTFFMLASALLGLGLIRRRFAK